MRAASTRRRGSSVRNAAGRRGPSEQRLSAAPQTSDSTRPWDRWGPFVSERSWGTIREDYSPHGTAWEFLTHDLARSKDMMQHAGGDLRQFLG